MKVNSGDESQPLEKGRGPEEVAGGAEQLREGRDRFTLVPHVLENLPFRDSVKWS